MGDVAAHGCGGGAGGGGAAAIDKVPTLVRFRASERRHWMHEGATSYKAVCLGTGVTPVA